MGPAEFLINNQSLERGGQRMLISSSRTVLLTEVGCVLKRASLSGQEPAVIPSKLQAGLQGQEALRVLCPHVDVQASSPAGSGTRPSVCLSARRPRLVPVGMSGTASFFVEIYTTHKAGGGERPRERQLHLTTHSWGRGGRDGVGVAGVTQMPWCSGITTNRPKGHRQSSWRQAGKV